jgi:hypothetical protein
VTKIFSALTAVWLSVVVVQGYIHFRHDTDRARRNPPLTVESATPRRENELRNAVREGRLIEIDEAMAIVEQMTGIFRAETAGLQARVARDLGCFGSQRSAALDDRLGSITSSLARLQDVRFSPDSSDIADIPQPPLGANKRLMRRNK